MKTILVIVLAITCIGTASYAAAEKPGPDAVIVKELTAPMPQLDEEKHKFLWDSFANKPDEEKFSSYTTVKWRQTFETFADTLVKKAADQKLDSISLRKALDLVLKNANDKVALLPVGAYQTTLDGSLVWIVVIKWENTPSKESKEHYSLGHISARVFDQKTLKDVGYMTCM